MHCRLENWSEGRGIPRACAGRGKPGSVSTTLPSPIFVPSFFFLRFLLRTAIYSRGLKLYCGATTAELHLLYITGDPPLQAETSVESAVNSIETINRQTAHGAVVSTAIQAASIRENLCYKQNAWHRIFQGVI